MEESQSVCILVHPELKLGVDSPHVKMESQPGNPFRFVILADLDTEPSLCGKVIGILTNPIKDPKVRHLQYLDRLPNVKGVVTFSTGTEVIDLELCRARGLRVARLGDVSVNSTADQAMALLLTCARKVVTGKSTADQAMAVLGM